MSLYQKLVRHVFWPLALWRNGDAAQLRYLAEYEYTQYLPEDALRHLQWTRLRTLLDHAYARCPLYRQRFQCAGLPPPTCAASTTCGPCRRWRSATCRSAAPTCWCATGRPRTSSATRRAARPGHQSRSTSIAAGNARGPRPRGGTIGGQGGNSATTPRSSGRVPRPAGRRLARGPRRLLLREPLWLNTGRVTEQALAEFHAALLRPAHRAGLRQVGDAVRPLAPGPRPDAAPAARAHHLCRGAGGRRPRTAGAGLRLSGVQPLRLPRGQRDRQRVRRPTPACTSWPRGLHVEIETAGRSRRAGRDGQHPGDRPAELRHAADSLPHRRHRGLGGRARARAAAACRACSASPDA